MTDQTPTRLAGCSVLPPMETTATTHSNPKTTSAKSRGTADRFGIINGFVDCSLADLSRAEALTWIVLWRDTKNGTARTGTADIARRIGTSRRAVTNAVAGLIRRGLLTVVYRGGLNRGTSAYRVHPLSKPEAT